MKRFQVALACLLVLAFGFTATAQEQGGSVTGTVKDASGGSVPGASVTIAGEAGSRTTVAEADGAFRFLNLRPGVYTVTASLPGFRPAGSGKLTLALGQTVELALKLSPGGVTEEVLVTAEAPVVDMKQTARLVNLRAEAIENMPKGRDFTSLVTQAPGANAEGKFGGGISIDGASSSENRYIVDGAETTNIQTGNSGKVLIVDFVEEVQVKSSGYTAEYGGATGGIINAITKSGTNKWRGQVGAYYSDSSFDGDPRPSLRLKPTNSNESEYVTYPKDTTSRLEPGFQIGGPIKKDKLFLFLGYQPSFNTADRTVNPTTAQTATATTLSKTQKDKFQNITGNLTANLGAKFSGRIAYNQASRTLEGLLPGLTGASLVTANYGVTSTFPNRSISGNVDYVFSDSHVMSLRGGNYTSDIHDEGIFIGPKYNFSTSNIGLAGVPANLQQATGYSNAPTNNARTRDIQKRLSLQLEDSIFFNGKGQHAFKFGAQADRVGNDVLTGETGNRVTLLWDRALAGARGTYGYYQVRSNGSVPKQGFVTQGDVTNTNIGLFVQDAWSINNKLTLNLGIRSEKEKVPSYTTSDGVAPVAIDFSFQDKLAPRLGFAYDVKGDGKWKIAGSWGVFYDIFKLELPRGSFGGDKWLEYYYSLDTPNWPTLVDAAGCPPACPGRLLRGPVDFRHPSNSIGEETVDPDMMPFKLQEAVVMVERQVSAKSALVLRYVHKQVDVAIEDVGSLDAQGNEIYTIGNPGFGLAAQTGFGPAFPKAVRDYDAVELAFNKQMANNWSLRASYIWSRLYGNYSGLAQSDENGRQSPNVGRGFDYPLMAFDEKAQPVYGLLATDRPHQFKTQIVYDAKFLTVGAHFRVASGIPMTREAAFITGSGYPIQYLGRGSDGRTPVFSNTDLFLQRNFKIGANRLSLNVNIENLLDQSTVVNRNTTELAAGQQINVGEAEFFRGVNTQALIASQKLARNPLFLKDNGYQAPRSVRIGAAFAF